jgi:hypothetical protein
MRFPIHRPRPAIGWLYIVMYGVVCLAYVLILEDDRAWALDPKFTAAVVIWFLLSLAVKISMVTNRVVELLNAAAMVAFLSMGFTYHPNPDDPNSLQTFCYYLFFLGGPLCDVFDFIYTGAAKRPEDPCLGPEK